VADRALLQRFDQAGPLTWLLAAIAGWALLLWLAALLGMGGQVDEATPLATEADLPQPRPAAPDRIGPLAQYSEAAARPLFTQDRRPRSFLATGSDGEEAAQSQTLDFILTGVLISPQVRLAVLQPNGGGEAQRVHVGKSPEGAAGWTLVEVQPRRAIFEGAGGQSALDLRTFGDAAAPTATPVASPPPPPPPPAAVAAERPVASPEQQSEAARIDAIRKRIEARRAQLRAGQSGNAPASSAPSPQP
jgi:general secretion pathway protein N